MFEKLKPTLQAGRLYEISIEQLRKLGIRNIFLDMDNTLARWHEETIDSDTAAWVQSAKAAGLKLFVVSNSKSDRPERMAHGLGIGFEKNARKPFKASVQKLLKRTDMKPAETLMAGDQLFTDILLANKLQMPSVLLTPISDKEWWATKLVNRTREKLVWNFVFPKEKR